MTWLFFCFIAIGFTVTYGLISKKILSNKINHHPLAYASALFFSVALYSFFFYFATSFNIQDFKNLFSLQVLPILALNLTCYTIAPSLYYRALKKLPISEVTILYSLTGIYALIIGVFIGSEVFSLNHLLGGLIIVSAILVLTLKEGRWNSKSGKYAGMMVLATCIYAVAAIADNQIITHKYFNTLFFQTLSFGIPSLAVLLINPQAFRHLKKIYNHKVYPTVLFNALFFFISFFAIYSAYKYGGNTSQVNLVLCTETVVTVIFAALFLKERTNLPLKIFAAVLAGAGVYLLR